MARPFATVPRRAGRQRRKRPAPAAERRRVTAPALVVGHPRDLLHPASDAAMVADELPNATLESATSILEWRRKPERLDLLTTKFVLDCWRPARRKRRTAN